MLYCLKCRKNTESKNPKTMLKLGKSCYFPVVQGVNPGVQGVNPSLSKNKKPLDC